MDIHSTRNVVQGEKRVRADARPAAHPALVRRPVSRYDAAMDDPSRSTGLAAIMFTDIAGYSRMMEEDEERTIDVLKRHNDIVLPLIEAADGDVIDKIGDGLFVLFPSVRSAVTCATSIQDAVAMSNRSVAHDERFMLRVGIHLGEIWRDGDGVYGNGVNIAARVQPFARPGGVCITEDVRRQIGGGVGVAVRSIGARPLKNITRRIELFEIETGNEEADEPDDAQTGRADRSGEFDRVKERLMSERERMSARHAASDPDSIGNAIESKVFSVVEHVMDRALAKWEQMPSDKKAEIVGSIRSELDGADSDGDIEISLGGSNIVTAGSRRKRSKEAKLLKEARESIGWGVVASAGFGFGYFISGIGWMVWPFLLIGVLPFVSGVTKFVQYRRERRRARAERPRELERRILSAARDLGGSVSVVQIAARTDHGLDEIQQTLDTMAGKGYVTVRALDTGGVVYDFPDLARGGPAGSAGGRGY